MKRINHVLLVAVCISLISGIAIFHVKAEHRVYVNDWPVFSFSYPSTWIEKTPDSPIFSFKAEDTKGIFSVRVLVIPNTYWNRESMSIKQYVHEMSTFDKNFKVLYDKPVKLNDNTAAHEIHAERIYNKVKRNVLILAVQRDNLVISIAVSSTKGKISEDLKQIVYSLKIEPGEDKLASIPSDIQEFINEYTSNIINYDIEKVLGNYSDQFLHNGIDKQAAAAAYMTMSIGPKSYQVNITKFESQGNKAHIAGFLLIRGKKQPLPDYLSYLIKENGQWKFYGNQKQRM